MSGVTIGRDLPQDPPTESATLRREAAALVIGQPEAASLHLLLQDAVLLHQVLDDGCVRRACSRPRAGRELEAVYQGLNPLHLRRALETALERLWTGSRSPPYNSSV